MAEPMDAPTLASVSRVVDYGDHALLLEFSDTAEVLAWADGLRAANLLGVLDIVPASHTILVKLAASRYRQRTRQRLTAMRLDAAPRPAPAAPDVVIDVVYDGADLEEVARWASMSVDDVIAAHTATPFRVGFGGFSPGFAYLVGGDARLHVPRRAEPRVLVPAGSVGLAGEFSGVYPRESPGGWQLIGRTDAVLWDLDRDPPALLIPGTSVQFRAVG